MPGKLTAAEVMLGAVVGWALHWGAVTIDSALKHRPCASAGVVMGPASEPRYKSGRSGALFGAR
jgi:hypothetical protein